jgi:hypothetical protein
MEIYIPRQPQERLYLVKRGPKGISYHEVAFLGWLSHLSSGTPAEPIGLKGSMFVVPPAGAWVLELAEKKFTSPTLGTGVFNDLQEVLGLLDASLAKAAEEHEQYLASAGDRSSQFKEN